MFIPNNANVAGKRRRFAPGMVPPNFLLYLLQKENGKIICCVSDNRYFCSV